MKPDPTFRERPFMWQSEEPPPEDLPTWAFVAGLIVASSLFIALVATVWRWF